MKFKKKSFWFPLVLFFSSLYLNLAYLEGSAVARPPPQAHDDNGIRIVDLTLPLATFAPSYSDLDLGQAPGDTGFNVIAPDLLSPVSDSTGKFYSPLPELLNFPSPVLGITTWNIAEGATFHTGQLSVNENDGTQMDAPAHFTPEPGHETTHPIDQRTMSELTARDLIGKVIIFDITARVNEELRKANPDWSPTSAVHVTAADIDAVANQLESGAYLLVRTGWDQFYFDPDTSLGGPYMNGFRWPGFRSDAIDRIIELEEAKGIRINGLGTDTRTPEVLDFNASGQLIASAHTKGLHRGWKLLECLTNLGALSKEAAGGRSWLLFVGGLKHVGGFGSPARVLAVSNIGSLAKNMSE